MITLWYKSLLNISLGLIFNSSRVLDDSGVVEDVSLNFLIICLIFMAIIIGITHLLIDTRIPTQWWCKITRKTNLPFVLLEVDQTFHILIIAIFALICGKWFLVYFGDFWGKFAQINCIKINRICIKYNKFISSFNSFIF